MPDTPDTSPISDADQARLYADMALDADAARSSTYALLSLTFATLAGGGDLEPLQNRIAELTGALSIANRELNALTLERRVLINGRVEGTGLTDESVATYRSMADPDVTIEARYIGAWRPILEGDPR